MNKQSSSQQKFGRELWLPNTEPPAWLDGSLPGDRGFDPLGLSKPVEFVQMSVDELEQNNAVNKMGTEEGRFKVLPATVTEQSLQPYTEVFDLARFRECELIHGRWCMLAALGIIVAELSTGVSWVDAGKVELERSTYLGFELPFSIQQLCYIEAILMGIIEVYRSKELDFEKRLYPGGYFDPLGTCNGTRVLCTFSSRMCFAAQLFHMMMGTHARNGKKKREREAVGWHVFMANEEERLMWHMCVCVCLCVCILSRPRALTLSMLSLHCIQDSQASPIRHSGSRRPRSNTGASPWLRCLASLCRPASPARHRRCRISASSTRRSHIVLHHRT